MKCINGPEVDRGRMSSPSRGTWIEMLCLIMPINLLEVVPLAGDVD